MSASPKQDRPNRRPQDVTQMLIDWNNGNREALAKLTLLVYEELRRIARHYLRRERPGHTLQATALVHEAYLRRVNQKNVSWQNRAHFFSVAAEAMRRILVEHARRYRAAKRRGAAHRLTLDEAIDWSDERAMDLVALDDALSGLAAIDPQKSHMVVLRFFGGLTIAETAEVLGLSPATRRCGTKWSRCWRWRSRRLA